MSEDVANREVQTWIASSIALEGELQHQQQKLRQALQQSENLHFADLFRVAAKNSAQLEAELKHLTEQNQSLKQELCAANRLLSEYRQELDCTNQELNEALNTGSLSLTSARQLAKSLLDREESTKDALAAILSAVYRTPVKPWEMQPIAPITQVPLQDRSKSAVKSSALSNEAAQYKEHYESLTAKFAALKAQLVRLEAELSKGAAGSSQKRRSATRSEN
ncbi:hypothetical protein IFO70_20870 [Phormidium tenue FACHB-886]|nr:hypothetical protein [Phormidium tenue FACHB-886]